MDKRYNIKTDNLLLILIPFAITFISYISKIVPAIYWRDNAEFITVGYTLGISHPAGSPLYSQIAKLFTFLPIGSIAFKINLLSLFFGSITISLIALIAYLVINELIPPSTPLLRGVLSPLPSWERVRVRGNFRTKSFERWLIIFASISSALIIAFSRPLGKISIEAEVYALQNFFILLIVYLLLLAWKKGDGNADQYIYGASFLFGLSAGVHIIMLFYLPVFFLFVFFTHRENIVSLKKVSILTLFFLVGISISLYLPLRSMTDPYYDWGNPETVENFMRHVTDRKDKAVHLKIQISDTLNIAKNYLRYYPDNFSLIGIFLGFSGIVYLFRKSRLILLFFTGIFFAQWLFFIRYWKEATPYIPGFIIFSIFVGVGIYMLVSALKALIESHVKKIQYRRILTGTVILSISFQLLLLFYFNFDTTDRGGYWSARDFFVYLIDDVEYNSLLFSSITWFGLSYLQQCEGYRHDLTLISHSNIYNPKFFMPITRKRYPLIELPPVEGKVPQYITRELILLNSRDHGIYWEPSYKFDKPFLKNLLLNGFFYNVVTYPTIKIDDEIKNIHDKKIIDLIERVYDKRDNRFKDKEEINIISFNLINLASYLIRRGEYAYALSHLKVAESLYPDNESVLNMIGVAFAELRDIDKAEEYFESALKKDPFLKDVLKNLGYLYIEKREFSRAEEFFRRVILLDPEDIKANFGLAESLEHSERYKEAVKYYETVVNINDKSEIGERAALRILELKEGRISDNEQKDI